MGTIVNARGPPEHRFYQVLCIDGRSQWVLHKQIEPRFQYLVDLLLLLHTLPAWPSVRSASGEHRCMQCNEFFLSSTKQPMWSPPTHIQWGKALTTMWELYLENVWQSFREGLSRVYLHGAPLANRYKAKWVGLTLTADGDELSHVRSRLLSAEIHFGQHRKTLGSNLLSNALRSPSITASLCQEQRLDVRLCTWPPWFAGGIRCLMLTACQWYQVDHGLMKSTVHPSTLLHGFTGAEPYGWVRHWGEKRSR